MGNKKNNFGYALLTKGLTTYLIWGLGPCYLGKNHSDHEDRQSERSDHEQPTEEQDDSKFIGILLPFNLRAETEWDSVFVSYISN